MIDETARKRIADAITGRLATSGKSLHCPMCGHDKFMLVDGYFTSFIQDALGKLSLGGPGVPTVALICLNCGFLSQHAMGVLGLLAKKEETTGNPDKEATQSDKPERGVR